MARNRLANRAMVVLSLIVFGVAALVLWVPRPVAPDGDGAAASLDVQGEPVLLGAVWHEPAGSFWHGVELAVARINGEGGLLGRPVRVVARTDRSSLGAGMAIAQELASTPGLVAVVGHYNSFVAVSAAGVYERAGIVFITPAATSPRLTQLGYRHVFRSVTSDTDNAGFLAAHLLDRGYRRIAVYYTPDPYGRGFANGLEDALRLGGGDVVDRISYFGDEVMLTRLVQTWHALGVDALVVADVLPQAGEFIEGVRRAGYAGPIAGGDGLHDPNLFRYDVHAVEGLTVVSHFNARSPRPETRAFVAAYRDRFGEAPEPWAALAYDAVLVFAEGVRRAQSFDPEQVSRALRNGPPWSGATGSFAFDQRGDPAGKEPVLRRVHGGRFVYVDEAASDGVDREAR